MKHHFQYLMNQNRSFSRSNELSLQVQTKSILKDSFCFLFIENQREIELKKKIRIIFIGKSVIDMNELLCEYFQVIVHKMLESSTVHFIRNRDFYWFNSSVNDIISEQTFSFTDIIFG
jgi:hypothetical protein